MYLEPQTKTILRLLTDVLNTIVKKCLQPRPSKNWNMVYVQFNHLRRSCSGRVVYSSAVTCCIITSLLYCKLYRARTEAHELPNFPPNADN